MIIFQLLFWISEGLSPCVLAGSYGGGAGFNTYAAYRPAVYQQVGYAQTYHQPYYTHAYAGNGVDISGGSGEIIIFLIIICKLSLIFKKKY